VQPECSVYDRAVGMMVVVVCLCFCVRNTQTDFLILKKKDLHREMHTTISTTILTALQSRLMMEFFVLALTLTTVL
jgi:hypothetical protein